VATSLTVFRCHLCGVRTVDPFVIPGPSRATDGASRDVVACAMCADAIVPDVVSARERVNRRRFSDSKVPTSRYRD